MNPLDLITSLKGNDNTELVSNMKDNEDIEKENKQDINNTNIVNSFYTESNEITSSDFEDIEDFKDSIESKNIVLKIIIALVVTAFIIGVVLLIKTLFFK